MNEPPAPDRNLSLEMVRVTEAAALAAARHMGSGDPKIADRAAIEAAHRVLESNAIDGTIKIGESGDGEAKHLCVGDRIGRRVGPEVDVAVVALEGASIVARGGPNALSVVAMAESGSFLKVPEIYMDKIAVGPGLPAGVIDISKDPLDNLKAVAEAKRMPISDMVICVLDRPRHNALLDQIRAAGARVRLILGGDVSAVVATALPEAGVDMYLGIGGAPEGVIAAAALRGVGGQMQGRLVYRRDEDRTAAAAAGIKDFERVYGTEDMAGGNVTFAATGVTYGALLRGVRTIPGGAVSHSLVIRSMTGTFRYIEAHHDFVRRPPAG
ncbi:MAG: class II fructose-bisphosphatase [Proteobacteria bacterium]|nr:class II fructose-bisphosphatase [Pseudomonadota bacterium]